MGREQRKLAAVMAADVVGYSRLMGRDESGTLARLKQHRAERLEPTLARHGGRLVKLTGDGALVEFASAVDALRAAIEFQDSMALTNQELPTESRIVFRVGLHLGDMIVEGDDLYGDGVNIAARLESEAPPGGIVISGALRDAVVGKLKTGFVDLGRLSLKNIDTPIQAFRIDSDASSGTTSVTPGLALPDKPSIAVLPFQNMSGDPEQEYFVDGLVEDITTALSRVKSFFVVARNSAFTYRGRAVDVRQVGRELGVRYVLEGSARKAGNRLRITGQLVDAESGIHLWAERYDGSVEDVFDLQDRITASVAGALRPTLRDSEIRHAQAKPTTDLTSYELLWRAYAAFYVLTPASYNQALALLERAVSADPGNSTAWGLMAWCYVNGLSFAWSTPDPKARGLHAARMALQAGRDDSFALSAAGMAMARFGDDLEEAFGHTERALELNVNDASACNAAGWVSFLAGRHARSIECFGQAIRLSPLDPLSYGPHTGLSFPLIFTSRFEEALAAAGKALSLEASYATAHLAKVVALVKLDRREEAHQAGLRLLECRPDFSISNFLKNTMIRFPDQRALVETALRKAGLPK